LEEPDGAWRKFLRSLGFRSNRSEPVRGKGAS
jgi:hypothetical protein